MGGGLRLYKVGGRCNNCSWINCRSARRGGGIGVYMLEDDIKSVVNEELNIEGCVFASNSADTRGGAIDVIGIKLKCTNCVFLFNTAELSGGASACDIWYNMVLTNTHWVRNFVSSSCENGGGGAVFIRSRNSSDVFNLTNSIFIRNTVDNANCICIIYLLFIY
jgi:predicted outer membrane repeat protein